MTFHTYSMGPLNIADNEAIAEEIAANEDDKESTTV